MEKTERIRIFYEIINKITTTSITQGYLPDNDYMKNLVITNNYVAVFNMINIDMASYQEEIEAEKVKLKKTIDKFEAITIKNTNLIAQNKAIENETKEYEAGLKTITNKTIESYKLTHQEESLVSDYDSNRKKSAEQLMRLNQLNERVLLCKNKYDDLLRIMSKK